MRGLGEGHGRIGEARGAIALALAAALSSVGGAGAAEQAESGPAVRKVLPRVAAATEGMERHGGLLDLYVDRDGGRVWLALPAADGPRGEIGRFVHAEGLVQGLGSNPVGLDRGELGETGVVALRRVGNRILVERENLAFRAETDDAEERRAVAESFASSVVWAGEIAAADPDGSSLVDFTSFVVRDAHGVAARLDAAGQGRFVLDPARSAPALERCRVFPDNLELEAVLTWAGERPGELVREVAPDPAAVSLVLHQSLLRLPDAGFRPRRFDPRSGAIGVRFVDYGVPIDEPVERAFVVRHRLAKTDPHRARSNVVEPIVYHVDRAVPEPVRSALIEGASWWARAFDAAGFIDAFRVELLPEGVDPLDARYHVIEWVHRSTRGWSYGGGMIDPRTGEMIKAHVRLGSLRVRQDRLLFEGLLGADGTGSGGAGDPVELALARIRQLAAHEVGHTLGLTHNFAASTYGGRASVMDYPAPLVALDATGGLDVSQAYGVGVGVWDVQAIRYAYAEWPPGADEARELDAVVRDGLARGMVFLGDADARPAGAASPRASLWDNGSDAVEQLERTLEVRRVALERFGERNVAPGRPLALLEEVLATLYLHHRYQLEAAVKTVGGMDYTHALRGDGQPPARPVDAARQRRALEVVLATLDPVRLVLPDGVAALLLPRPDGSPASREQFSGRSAPAFDPLAAAATAADLAIAGLLQPERCARVVNFHAADPALPSLEAVLDALIARAFDAVPPTPAEVEVRDEVQRVLVARLIGLSADRTAAGAVRARVDAALEGLAGRLAASAEAGAAERFLIAAIDRHRRRTDPAVPPARPAPDAPPGSPIGTSRGGGDAPGCSLDRPDGL